MRSFVLLLPLLAASVSAYPGGAPGCGIVSPGDRHTNKERKGSGVVAAKSEHQGDGVYRVTITPLKDDAPVKGILLRAKDRTPGEFDATNFGNDYSDAVRRTPSNSFNPSFSSPAVFRLPMRHAQARAAQEGERGGQHRFQLPGRRGGRRHSQLRALRRLRRANQVRLGKDQLLKETHLLVKIQKEVLPQNWPSPSSTPSSMAMGTMCV